MHICASEFRVDLEVTEVTGKNHQKNGTKTITHDNVDHRIHNECPPYFSNLSDLINNTGYNKLCSATAPLLGVALV